MEGSLRHDFVKEALACKWATCCLCVLVSRGVLMHLASSSFLFIWLSFGLKTFFVESVCVDPEVIAANIVVSKGKFALTA